MKPAKGISRKGAAFIALFLFVVLAGRNGLAGGNSGNNGNGGSGQAGFQSGDVIISLITGEVQWRRADGSLVKTLQGRIPGKADGMAFDAALNLYVTHFCADATCRTGNSVERFSRVGNSLGAFGRGYNCNPSSIVFDSGGLCYVGQADCSGDILKFSAAGASLASFDALVDNRGTLMIDLASDGCTVFYTSGSNAIKRYNLCAAQQLPDFATLPDVAFGIKILDDGGVLVADNSAILRLNAAGEIVQTYDVPGQPDLWLSLDLAQNGSFWVANFGSSDVYRFDLASGEVLGLFNSGTPYFTVKAVACVRTPSAVSAGGRMTGGGSIFTAQGVRVTHGFELHCDPNRLPNNLEVNWQGNQFHLESVTEVECTDDPTINPTPPTAAFDTYHATGTGSYNHEDGATIEWTFTDAGEPGKKDRATMVIRDAGGVTVLEVSNNLTYGNHQAHK